jgi:oligo-alginate lyase
MKTIAYFWLTLFVLFLNLSVAQDVPGLEDLAERPFPRIAVTETEITRLRNAYAGEDDSLRSIVADKVRDADVAMNVPITYPPRGGQHNQWYQCDDCQLALRTIDETHHQCPSCEKTYSGEPYDDVIYSRIHSRNLQAMNAAAWASIITEDAKYARFAANILLAYADRYQDYPYHAANLSTTSASGGHLFEQTLTEASAMAGSIVPGYDLVRASDVLTEEEDERIREGLLRPMLRNITKVRSGKSNWQTWHNAAMLAAGAVLGEGAYVERALSDPGNGFYDQMKISVSEEGMWYENSWAYHFYTLRAMIHIAEYARRIDVNVWKHPSLQKMFTIAIGYAMPGGCLPRFGDDVNSRLAHASGVLEFAYHAYFLTPTQPFEDPRSLNSAQPATFPAAASSQAAVESRLTAASVSIDSPESMRPFLTKSPTWDSILLGRELASPDETPPAVSALFPSAGHAVARTGGPKGLASVMTFGPYGGFHGHFDKLSFVFFGCDQELGVDPGRSRSQAYRLPIHKNWYKATIGHNAVLVDAQSQSPASGKLLLFDVQPTHTITIAQCDEAYEGVVHTRAMLQTEDYLLVFDDLVSEEEHRYDWFYHNRGGVAPLDVGQRITDPEDNFVGMEYVQNVSRRRLQNEALRIAFAATGVINVLTLNSAEQTDVLTGDGVGESVLERIPVFRATRYGSTVRFAAVLEPVSVHEPTTVKSVSWEEDDEGILVTVNRGDDHDRLIIDADWSRAIFTPQE